MAVTISQEDQQHFVEKGYVVLRGFYDLAADVAPIQEGIRSIVALVCGKYGIDAPTGTAAEAMTIAYPSLIASNRAWGGEVYDAVKQIPAFLRMVSQDRNDAAFRALRPDSLPGIAAGSFGIRIDNPGEEKFRAHWHQEFPSQLRSSDGVVFWSPLVPVTEELGPVQIAEGSQAEGPIPVYLDDKGVGATGAYALHLEQGKERVARYNCAAPLTEPGDLIVLDFMTLHQSGRNLAAFPRWSIQFRLFNFADPLGIRIGWRGSFAAGEDFAEIMPGLVARS
ncbi:phytanoyl-CoA dioxygenase family protein [Novosphingobium sp. RD2P27]|uniref:Phytanoyl-CoA dioxygenase family protein n=1 Tax=Novosphingobium kalidii TaxID=3230299 RepID=A0ABV2D502_9SPHN